MSTKLVYASKGQIGFYNGTSLSYLNSQHLTRYRENLESILRRKEWKDREMYPGMSNRSTESIMQEASVTGLAFIQDGRKLMYSFSVESISGIYIKDLDDTGATEGHVIHKNNIRFESLDYNSRRNEIALAVSESYNSQNIALMAPDNSVYREITGGDSTDDNPAWSQSNPDVLFFDSAGVATNASGYAVGHGPRIICRMNVSNNHLEEFVSMDKRDCFLPKADGMDNIYFISKPYDPPAGEHMTFKDLLLMPFRLLRAVFSWLNLFSTSYTGEPLSTAGPNPARAKEADIKTVIINGNIINAEKALKESRMKGEKYPGIAPQNWHLMKRDKGGGFSLMRKGVLDFDVTPEGEIIYSNGKFLIRINADGQEEVIDGADLLQKVKIFK